MPAIDRPLSDCRYKVTRELVERRDVNLPLAKDFLRTFCKRTLEGQVLPWLATRQGVAGYMLSRACLMLSALYIHAGD